MKLLKTPWNRILSRSWTIAGAALGLLIVAILAANLVLIRENDQVLAMVRQMLQYDIEIEDEGDDLRVAVLDMRHFQRDIMFDGPSNAALTTYDQAYARLLEEIADLERLGLDGLDVMPPERFRELTEQYYNDFRAATGLYLSDPAAFEAASSEALRRIEELDREAEDIDAIGEILAASSLERVSRAAQEERMILIGLTVGMVVAGAALAFAAWRLLSQLDASYQREQVAAAELAKALRLRTDFIADVSHELRTPLTVIRGNADIGLTSPEPAVQREVLGDISVEANRMSKLVDDLLFLARSDSGPPPLDLELVSGQWLVSRLERPAEMLARQRGACVETDFQGDGILKVDHARIEQALLNLIDNAARYTEQETCIRFTSREEGGEFLMEVSDQGPGMSAEDLSMIFDRFYRVRTRRGRKKTGSGLGLAITKTIVEAHGGSIVAESTLGVGTTMTIRLPVAKLSVTDAEAPEPAMTRRA